MVRYLVKSPKHVAQYVACNLLTKKYVFYSTSWIPEGKDPLLVDAKILLGYHAYLTKEQRCRRGKAGFASIKYVRCGRLCLLFATAGASPFFQREKWHDIRKTPLHISGYLLRVTGEGKVSVRLHEGAERKIRREMLEHAGDPAREWERKIFNLPFLAFRGVQDTAYALVQHLNQCRKLLRQPPVEWDRCIRRKIKSEPVFLDTPPEIEDLLRFELRRK